MNWIKSQIDRWFGEHEDEKLYSEEQHLIQDIRKAHFEWQNAHEKFKYAVGEDQVDYAIYTLEAAEKRYVMLLRQAKQQNVCVDYGDYLYKWASRELSL